MAPRKHKFILEFVATLNNKITPSVTKINKTMKDMSKISQNIKVHSVFVRANRAAKRFMKTINAIPAKLISVGQALQRIGRWLTFALTLPIVAFGKKAADTFIGFERNLNFTRAVLGKTKKEMTPLLDFMRDLGKTSTKSLAELSEGLLAITKAGEGTAIKGMLPVVAMMSELTKFPMAETANRLIGMMNAFDLPAEAAGSTADKIAAVANSVKSNFKDMSVAFEQAAPMAKQLGLTFEETAAGIGAFARTNMAPGRAGRTFSRLMRAMQNPTEQMQKALNKYNITLNLSEKQQLATGRKLRGLHRIVKEFEKLGDKNLVALNELFGEFPEISAKGVVGFMRQTAIGLEDLTKKGIDAEGTLKKLRDAIFEKTFVGAVAKLKQAFVNLGLSLFDYEQNAAGIAKITQDIIDKMTEVVTKVKEWTKQNPEITNMIAKVTAFVAVLGPVLTIVGSLVLLFGLVVKAAPFALLLIGAKLLFGGWVELLKFIKDKFIPAILELGEKGVRVFKENMVPALVAFGKKAVKVFQDDIVPAAEELGEVAKIIAAGWFLIGEAVKEVVALVSDAPSNMFAGLFDLDPEDVKLMLNTIKGMISGFIKDIVRDIKVNLVSVLPSSMVELFGWEKMTVGGFSEADEKARQKRVQKLVGMRQINKRSFSAMTLTENGGFEREQKLKDTAAKIRAGEKIAPNTIFDDWREIRAEQEADRAKAYQEYLKELDAKKEKSEITIKVLAEKGTSAIVENVKGNGVKVKTASFAEVGMTN